MKILRHDPTSPTAGTADFDLLRARLEVEVARPAVIAITSSTTEDGKDIAARGLAYSLGITGYATLYVDATLASHSLYKPAPGLTFEEIGRQIVAGPRSETLEVLTLGDSMIQKTTSQQSVRTTLDVFRKKFDYVVVNAEHGVSTSFAMSIIAAADAVLVTVKKGRRQHVGDVRLSGTLKRFGARFLGVLALDAATVKNADSTIMTSPGMTPEVRRGQTAYVDKDRLQREAAEWPT